MPSKSQSQRAWAFGVKGPAWAREHHFDNPGKLPEHVNAAGGLDSVPLPKGIARGTQPMAAPRNPGYDLFKRKLMLVRARKRPGTAQQPGLPPDLPQSPF